jgi:hypothetical protein
VATDAHPNRLPPAPTKGDFSRSDLGNAHRLYAAYGDRLAWDYAADQWLIWDGKVWRPDAEEGAIFRYAHSVVLGMVQQAVEQDDSDYRDFAVRALSHPKIKALIESAKETGDFTVPSAQWDADPFVLNTPSGLLYFEDGTGQVTLDAHRASANCSRMTAAAYDPDAKCPTWDAFISQAMCGRPELSRYFQKLIGYASLGLRREQMISFSYGIGGNGKSTERAARTTASCRAMFDRSPTYDALRRAGSERQARAAYQSLIQITVVGRRAAPKATLTDRRAFYRRAGLAPISRSQAADLAGIAYDLFLDPCDRQELGFLLWVLNGHKVHSIYQIERRYAPLLDEATELLRLPNAGRPRPAMEG